MELFLIWILVLNNQRQSVSIFIDLTILNSSEHIYRKPESVIDTKKGSSQIKGNDSEKSN